MPKGGDNDGTRWARVVKAYSVPEVAGDWDHEFHDSHVEMRTRGLPDPDLPVTPNVIPPGQVFTSDMMEGKVQMPTPCSRCGEPLGVRVTAGPTYGSLLCQNCSDPRELSWVKKPRGRPRTTT